MELRIVGSGGKCVDGVGRSSPIDIVIVPFLVERRVPHESGTGPSPVDVAARLREAIPDLTLKVLPGSRRRELYGSDLGLAFSRLWPFLDEGISAVVVTHGNVLRDLLSSAGRRCRHVPNGGVVEVRLTLPGQGRRQLFLVRHCLSTSNARVPHGDLVTCLDPAAIDRARCVLERVAPRRVFFSSAMPRAIVTACMLQRPFDVGDLARVAASLGEPPLTPLTGAQRERYLSRGDCAEDFSVGFKGLVRSTGAR